MIGFCLIAWGLLAAALIAFAIGRGREGGPLTLAYFLGLSLIHVPGALAFLPGVGFPSTYGSSDGPASEAGFVMTVVGMAAFVVGAILARRGDRRGMALRPTPSYRRSQAFERVGRRGLAVGAVAYFILLPLSHSIASLTAATSPFAMLLIVGFWLLLYGAVDAGDRRRTVTTFALLPLLPLATLVTGGYLGYGIYWVLSILAFQFVITPRRDRFYAAAPFVIYLGLSLFVAYMDQRSGIRELIWEKRAGFAERIDRVSRIVTEFHPFDPTSPTDLMVLDERLNQNVLVGLVIARIDAGRAQFAYGATVPLWALLPRAAWPEKPAIGGGRDIVNRFTGIHFWEDTSVGAGQVLEFYVNFGLPGVMAGFLLVGFVLMRLDRGIMRALAQGDTRGLLLRAMPGLTMLQPGSNLLEILVGVIAAVAIAFLLTRIRVLRLVWAAPQIPQPA